MEILKRPILMIFALLCFCINIHAQQLSKRNAPADLPFKAHITPDAGQAWWGYYDGEESKTAFGLGTAGTYNCAVYIPADHDVAKDSKIYAERIWFAKKAYASDVKIWISKTLPATPEEADIVCKSVDYTKGGVVDYGFDEPYQIQNEGVYVGFTFTIAKTTYTSDEENEDNGWPIYTTSSSKQNALFMKVGTWKNWYSNLDIDSWDGNTYPTGNLAMQVLLGDNFYNNAARIKSVGTGIVALGGEVNVPVTIQNMGGNSFLDFYYTVTIDGVESEPVLVDASENPIFGIFGEETYEIPVKAGTKTGETAAEIKITKVNSEANEVQDGTEAMNANIVTVAKKSNRKTVMENFLNTTDDGYSLLSWFSNDRLSRDWHEELVNPIPCRGNHKNYIGIQVHDRDAFATDYYINRLLELDALKDETRLPFIFTDVDRESTVLQYFGSQYYDEYNRRTKFGIEDDFGDSQDETVEAEVQVSTTWGDTGHTLIRTTVSTTFQYDTDNAHYALAFALVEDGKTGTLSNGVLPMTQAGGMFQWDPLIWDNYVNGPNVIENATFNDVLVGADEIMNGIAGSINAPIKCGETQYYLHKFDLSYNTYIENKDNLKVVAMLIDTNTGRIVNANRARIGEDSEDEEIEGIKTVDTDNDDNMVYDLLGRRVRNSYRGIVIKNGKKYLK